jgi:hypothetical protein
MLGYIVQSTDVNRPLRSGCGHYPEAVCISEEPFILVSLQGDMRWESTVNADNFTSVRPATKEEMEIANTRR